jgi:hypothetical protein
MLLPYEHVSFGARTLICQEAASVAHAARSFAAKMKLAGRPYIKIMPKNHNGKNFLDKWVK